MFPVVERRRAKRRRPWSSTKSRCQKQNYTTSLLESNVDQSAPQISIQTVFVNGLYSYCHLLCHTCLRVGGHEYWDAVPSSGLNLPRREAFMFLFSWLFDFLNRKVPLHPKDLLWWRSHWKHTFMKSLRVWTQQGFMFAILHIFHRFGSIYTTHHIHSLLWTPESSLSIIVQYTFCYPQTNPNVNVMKAHSTSRRGETKSAARCQ